MTFRNLLIGATAAALTGAVGAANAATTTGGTQGNASVTITVPSTVTQVSGIAFGSIARPMTGTSTVTIAATSGATAVADSNGAVVSGSSNPASFNVTGQGSSMAVHAALSFGADDSKFGTLAATPSAATLTLDSSNSYAQTVYVGAAIPVKATTPPGAYNGTLTLSVDFP